MKRFTEFRIFILLSVVLALTIGLLFYLNLRQLHTETLQSYQEQKTTLAHLLHSQIQSSSDNFQLIASLYAKDPLIQDLFLKAKRALNEEGGGRGGPRSAALRQQLYEAVAPEWQAMIGTTQARQLHFHLGTDVISFLRVHEPQRFGDSLRNIRPLLVHSMELQQPASGLETGRASTGIRGVVPVFHDLSGEFIGTLEAGATFQQILQTVKSEYRLELAVLLNQEHVKQTMWPAQQ